MSNEDLEQAYDEVCNGCDLATRNSSDGGKLPCNNHKRLFQLRTYPVIKMDGMYEGEWTHCAVDTESIDTWLEALLEEWDESSLTISEFLRNLNVQVVQMTKEEYQRIPEL